VKAVSKSGFPPSSDAGTDSSPLYVPDGRSESPPDG
jgi:hypothetical protein